MLSRQQSNLRGHASQAEAKRGGDERRGATQQSVVREEMTRKGPKEEKEDKPEAQ